MCQQVVRFIGKGVFGSQQHSTDHAAGFRSGKGTDPHRNAVAVLLQCPHQLSVFRRRTGHERIIVRL